MTLQTSKKMLIFLYIICIFVFISASCVFLYLKGEYFHKNLDAMLINTLNSNDSVKTTYESLEGDPLSSLNINSLNLKFINVQNSIKPLEMFIFKINLILYPLTNILRYAFISEIPIELNFYKNRLTFAGETLEVSSFTNKMLISQSKSNNYLLKCLSSFDISSTNIATPPASPITMVSEAFIGETGFLAFKGFLLAKKLSLIFYTPDRGALIYPDSSAKITFEYLNEKNKVKIESSEIHLCAASLNIDRFEYTSGGNISAEIKIKNFNLGDFFRKFPISKIMIMSETAQCDLKLKTNLNDWRFGKISAMIKCKKAKLLEYNPEENRVFSEAGLGDFVTSLGLTPQLVSEAGSITALASVSSGEIIIESLKIKSPHYRFTAEARADINDRLNGKMTLVIPQRVLKNNTINADFSQTPEVKIYGKIMGTLESPFIIYDMDSTAILKVTQGFMYDKLKDMFKSKNK